MGDGTAQVPLKEMYNKLGQRPKEALRAALIEVFETLTATSNNPTVSHPPTRTRALSYTSSTDHLPRLRAPELMT